MPEDAPERKVALGPNIQDSLRDGVNPVVLILDSTRLNTRLAQLTTMLLRKVALVLPLPKK